VEKNARLVLFMPFLVFASMRALGQPDTVFIPSDVSPAEGDLNIAVQSAITAGKLSNTVFLLEPDGYYVLSNPIVVPAGNRLTIVGPDPGTTQSTAPPRILWTSRDSVDTKFNFDCFGDIMLKNVWLLYARTDSSQAWSGLEIEDSPDTINGQRGDFEGVIFDYAGIAGNGGGCVTVASRHFRGLFRNCYFHNCTDPHFRYYGRAVSFPFGSSGWHIDSLRFENCTFANLGYVYMQEGGEYADHVWFNHCTFLNVVMFTFESGWWYWMNVSNSIFMNTYFYGDEPGMRATGSSFPDGGTLNIDSISAFGFSVPFTETDRHILFTHSSYILEEWLRDYMESGFDGTLDSTWLDKKWWPLPQPMMSEKTRAFFNNKAFWPYVARGLLFDSTDPGFVLAPTNKQAIKRFLYFKFVSSEDTSWAYNPGASLQGVWPMQEDLSYTNPALLTAGMGGFPLGDLYRWFPDKYVQWKSQAEGESARIDTWLSTGHDPQGSDDVSRELEPMLPPVYTLSQNYPNPFNPLTVIKYTVGGDRGRGLGARDISLIVYDVLGREVAVLVNGKKQPGTYIVQFDGSALASGVYYYRISAANFVQTRAMILTK
jgi:hypothetical protein